MPLNPAALATVGADLLECACQALVAAGRMDIACCDPDGNDYRSYLSAGAVTVEGCGCSCGVLAVQLVRLFETETPPGQIIGPSRCGTRQAVAEFQVQRHACVTDQGEMVRPPAVLTANATKVWTDLWVLWTGLECCVQAWGRDPQDGRLGWLVDSGPIDPLGGCAGVQVTLQVVVGPSCDCRPSTPEPIA